MTQDGPEGWMWAEACAMLARAERLHRQFFQPQASPTRLPVWEPPVDMIETEAEVIVLVALPGVDPDRVEVAIDNGALIVAGQRVLPPELRTAVIHRLELPQGRFERRVPLPRGRYGAVRRLAANGCLLISLRKAA